MPQPVVLTKRGRHGEVLDAIDPLGAVFAPVDGARRPAWIYGPKDRKTDQRPMFTCPRSAIPSHVWELFELWHACRLMRTLPRPGGWLDQPLLVRRAFPVFEALMQQAERRQAGHAPVEAAALVLGAVFGSKK